MKYYISVLVLFNLVYVGVAQKRNIDFDTPRNWPTLNPIGISNDGSYVLYSQYSNSEGNNLIVQSTNDPWKYIFYKLSNKESFFSYDSRFLIVLSEQSMLYVFDLNKRFLDSIPNVLSCAISKDEGRNSLIYTIKDSLATLIYLDLSSGGKIMKRNVQAYTLDNSGKRLSILYKATSPTNSCNLSYIDISTSKEVIIDHDACKTRSYVFDHHSYQFAYIKNFGNSKTQANRLKYFKMSMDSAIELADNIKDTDLAISGSEPRFSDNDDKLFFYLTDRIPIWARIKNFVVDLQMFSIADSSATLDLNGRSLLYVCLLNKEKEIFKLEQTADNDFLEICPADNQKYILISGNIIGEGTDRYWRRSARPDLFLVEVETGKRRLIKRANVFGMGPYFSPCGNYIFWYAMNEKRWLTYDIKGGVIHDVSSKVKSGVQGADDHIDYPPPCGYAGWTKGDSAFLIYDRYDIWKLDPKGFVLPVNVTGFYGAKNSTQLRVVIDRRLFEHAGYSLDSDSLIVSAFSIKDKKNFFFRLNPNAGYRLDSLGSVNKIVYFPYRYMGPAISGIQDPFMPMKAKLGNKWMVELMNMDKYPNLYITADYRNYMPLTFLEPQKDYNWYTAELVSYSLPNHIKAQAILYKPENFDPLKKYPVLFFCYEQNADALNLFIHPVLSNGVLNIPFFVSNGYLVCVPDILFYNRGHPGKSAYESVMAAVRYLSSKPWVDCGKIGLQGHSFGGWETNFILTKTDRFAAAISVSGTSNLISAYGATVNGGRGTYFYETGQGRIGQALSKAPELYIENSPIFFANKVRAPLLIVNNRGDHIVEPEQGIQFYYNLIRLNKIAWFLSYTNEGHTIDHYTNQMDFSIRMFQFFDHYLKGYPPAKWMVQWHARENQFRVGKDEFKLSSN